MISNELRIGNWVYLFGDALQLTKEHLIYLLQKDGLPDPITITEEWLLKFGFKRQNNAWNEPKCAFEYLSGFSIWNPPGSDTYSLNDTVMCPKIEFVHQLQNLFFCLTGKEL